jgi:class 3 adenylate cyclase
MLVAVAIFLSYKGNRQAYFFLIAWSFILLTISAAILNVVSNGSISYSNLIYAAELASAFEGIALSIALADRIKETNLAVAKSVKKELHVADQLRKIVYPHQIDMISRGIELESTMPTGVGEACVISLDIVGSSKIQHIYAKEFFRKVFSRCNEVMMEGYSKDDMRASAYRVKEMGDGFLCSVGYPFKSANPSIAHGAIELAYKFEQIFREEVDQLEYPERINCGIGISYDSLFGFYPQAGAKEYDLYGRAIVLATRYESMRKVILKSSDKVNLLIIQERVYKSLTKNLREKFIAFDLKKENFEVRDDPSAEVLYYAILSGAEESNVSAYPEISDLAS